MSFAKISLLKTGVAAGLAYALYRYAGARRRARGTAPRVAFAAGESTPGAVNIRNAGPEAMAGDQPQWDATDQASDESYPASDPPASNRFT